MAIAALRKTEPTHADALRRCMPLFAGQDQAVVPAIFDIEVVSALVRGGASPKSVGLFFERHFCSRRVVTIGPRATLAVRNAVGLTRLRAADALYVWVSAREGLPLVTNDREVLARAALAGVTAVAP